MGEDIEEGAEEVPTKPQPKKRKASTKLAAKPKKVTKPTPTKPTTRASTTKPLNKSKNR